MARPEDFERTIGPLDLANRAYAVRHGDPRRRKASPVLPPLPDCFLVFDTETSTDPSQRLLFGCFRYLEVDPDADDFQLVCLQEGLFHADDLAVRDPEGLETLRDYVRPQPFGDVDRTRLTAVPRLRLMSQTEFLKQILFRLAFRVRGGVVCFNSPFDLSRLAWKVGETRDRTPNKTDKQAGGFSFHLWAYREPEASPQSTRFRPALAIKSIDSKRSLKAFRLPFVRDWIDKVPEGRYEADEKWVFHGHFLDLRTLVFALTDKGHTLESACDALSVPYKKRDDIEHGVIKPENIDYCREDVGATANLLGASAREFLKHPVKLQATRAFSPASIGKAYLGSMGVRPVLERQAFDPKVLGWAMSAYYGGRAECRIRRSPVPVAYCDFLSMYPTVCSLLGVWNLLTSERVEPVEETESVQALLDAVTLDDVFDPKLWPKLVGIAQIEPDGDVVPVRARYSGGQSWQIGVNPLTSPDQPLWFTIADLVASKLLTGKTPRVLRAIRFHGRGKAEDLSPTSLLSVVGIDPKTTDFFQAIVEERLRVEADEGLSVEEREWRSKAIKVLANATSYGIYAQMTRKELPSKHRVTVDVYGAREEPHEWTLSTPEDPGEYTFPPIAAAITGGARLMLAALERCVADAGGSYAFCDTDSMAIVASKDGGPVPGGDETITALSWPEVDAIRDRFAALNPYEGDAVPESILELEDENFGDPEDPTSRRELWCYAISAKRYVLYTLDRRGEPELHAWAALDDDDDTVEGVEPGLQKSSEHGLGHLLNPVDPEDKSRDWIKETWMFLLRRELGLPAPEPDWLDRPAIGRVSLSSPRLHRLFKELNNGKPYAEQIKPFNFLNVAFVPKWERPADEQRMVLIAPYEKDPEKWLDAEWINRYSGRSYRITTEPSDGYVRPGLVTVQTYRDVLERYARHPEAKSCAATGEVCGFETRGLLERRPIELRSLIHIGKESNRLEDVEAGLVQDEAELLNQYDDLYTSFFEPVVLPKLKELGVRETARRTGLSPAAVSDVLTGKTDRPHPTNLQRYLNAVNDV